MGYALPVENQIDTWRVKRKLTVEQLAEMAGTKRTYLNKLRTGERRLNSDMIDRLAKALNVEPHQILGGTSDFREVPIYGEVPAGAPCCITEGAEPTGYIQYPTKNPDVFALQIKAQSHSMNMVAPPGSFVLVDPNDADPKNLDGFFVIANLAGECTFKRFRLNPPRLEPFSNDPSYETQYITPDSDFTIIGKVIGQFNDLR